MTETKSETRNVLKYEYNSMNGSKTVLIYKICKWNIEIELCVNAPN